MELIKLFPMEETESKVLPAEKVQQVKIYPSFLLREPTTLEQSGLFPKGWLGDEDPED